MNPLELVVTEVLLEQVSCWFGHNVSAGNSGMKGTGVGERI